MKAFLRGFNIDISQNTVYIYDTEGKLNKKGAVSILKYLKSEGFLMHDEVFLQVVSEEDDDDYDDDDFESD